MRSLNALSFRDVFRRGSRTYFHSSLFFPRSVRRDVFVLYAFVRTADDFVDRIPQDAAGFAAFRKDYEDAASGAAPSSPIIAGFLDLKTRMRFEAAWIERFLGAMASDLSQRMYETLEETMEYMVGSAEAIGLMMARIMGLPDASLPQAALLGRAMQYINFIRDIAEDAELGRQYLPASEARRFGLDRWGREAAERSPAEFSSFIRAQIRLYEEWQTEAEKGYRSIPKRFRIPVSAAGDMYKWTAAQIRKDPLVVFRKKVKPSKARIYGAVARRALSCPRT